MKPPKTEVSDTADRIGTAVAEYDRRCESGDDVDVWEFLTEYSDVAAELVLHFQRLHQYVGMAGLRPATAGQAQTTGSGDASAGRHTVIRELGRGGMGVVYLARQPGLAREVAVKKMRPDALPSPARLKRFEEEAKAAGGLGHPNIVAVYESGDEHGQPFYVMEYVEGDTLKSLLSRGVLEFTSAAELLACLAGAAHAAHAKGVVHRDLKPANVLLGNTTLPDPPGAVHPHGPDRPAVIPKLTDFGLAWREDSDQRITRPDDIIGTPYYMAPEQTLGRVEKVGPATDVYALGTILYECLTGTVPFKGKNELDTYEVIRSSAPVPPGQLRRKTPRDLETICLKCLEKHPARRYRTAQELGDDLNRFLLGKPILARRPSWVERGYKWARRRPAAAGLITLAAGSAVAFTLVLLTSNVALAKERNRTAEERDRTAAERDRTAEQRDLARELLILARKAVHDYTTRLNQDPRIRSRDLDELRKELLATAVGYYEAIVKLGGNDPELLEERARAYGRLAEITADVGAKPDALALYDKALQAFEGLVRDHPDNPAYRRSLATTLNQQANLFRRIDRPDRAEAAYRRAIDFWREVAAGRGAPPHDRQSLAGVCGNMGNYLREVGRPDTAEEYYRESREILEDLTTRHPEEAEFTRDRAATYRHIALSLLSTGRVKDAEQRMTQALDLGEALVKKYPRDEEYKVHLGGTLNNLAILYTDTGRPSEAEKAYRRAVELGEELAAAHPRLLAYRFDLSQALNNLGTLYGELGRFDRAEKELARARDIRLGLVEADPSDTEFQHELAGSFNNLGFLYKKQGNEPKAANAYREAMRIRDRLARSGPPSTDRRLGRAAVLNNQANLLADANQPGPAAKARAEGLDILRGLVKEFPDHPEYAQELSKVLVGLGGLAADRGDWESCLRSYGEALALRRKLAADHPTVTEYQGLITTVHNNLGRAYHFMKRYGDAEKEYQEAIRIDRDLTRRYPTIVTWRHSLVLHLNNLATTHGEAREHDKAEETFKAALEEATALERDFEPLPDYRNLRSSILNGLGVVYMRTGRRPLGEQAYRDAITLTERLHEEFPDNAQFAAGLGLKYGNMGDMTRNLKRPETALGWYGRSVDKLEVALAAQAENSTARGYLAQSYAKRAEFFTYLGRHEEAATDWESALKHGPVEMKRRLQVHLAISVAHLGDHARAARLAGERLRQPDLDPRSIYDLASVYGRCSGAAATDEKVDGSERRKLADEYEARAVSLLEKASGSGFFRDTPGAAGRLRTDAAFAPLRGRADFQKLLEDIGK